MRKQVSTACAAWYILLGWAGSVSLFAQLPTPELQSVYPPVVKAGSTIELTVEGRNIEGLQSLLFTVPGITVGPVSLPESQFRKHRKTKPNTLAVTIPTNAAAGLCEVRTLSYYGVSNPKILTILSSAAKLNTIAASNVEESAPELKMGEIAYGKFNANQIDYFRVTGKKGQHFSVVCTAEIIDSTGDATLVIKDENGTTLSTKRDTFYRDPVIDFTVPADGNYWIGVYDFTFSGGGVYSLHLTANSIVEAVFPPFGKRGSTGKFTLFGRQFPGDKKELEVSVPIPSTGEFALSPASPLNGFFPAFSWSYGKTGRPVRIGVSDLPPTLRDSNPGPQTIPVPCDVAGKFTASTPSRIFRFTGKKGTAYSVTVRGDAIQGRVDPYVVLEKIGQGKDGGETVSMLKDSDDFSLGDAANFPNRSRDPQFTFVADADGVYQITVIDQYGASGPFPFYWLSLGEARPDFDLIAAVEKTVFDKKYLHLASPVLRRGGVVPIRILMVKKGGLDTSVTISVEGVPPGVSADPVAIPPGSDSAFLVLRADPKAPAWHGEIRIIGKTKVNGREIVRQAQSASVVLPVKDITRSRVRSRLETNMILSVIDVENSPVLMTADVPGPLAVVLGQKLEIPVKLANKSKLKGNLIIEPFGLAGMKKPPVLTLASTKSEGKLTIPFVKSGNFAAKEGTFTFILKGIGTVSNYQLYPPALAQATENQKHLDELLKTIKDQAKKAAAEKVRKELATELAAAKQSTKRKDLQFAAFSQPITVRVNPVPKPAAAKK